MHKKILIVIIAFSICLLIIPDARAYELYPGYPKAWSSRTSYNQAALVHYDGNLESVYSSVSIATAYNRWAVSCSGNVYVTNTVTQNSQYPNGRIYYIVPTTNYWEGIVGTANIYWWLGVTLLYDTNGASITLQTASTTTSFIKSANILIQPTYYGTFSSLTTNEKNCVVTHEIGHALGFGHPKDSQGNPLITGYSIMDDGAISYTSIQTLDKNNLIAKYPRP